jgi:heme/copper-type cytochrome/quinol oxidase subunit 2
MDYRKKPDTLLATLMAIGRLSLVVIGLVGVTVHLFREEGWLNQMLGQMLVSSSWLLIIPLALVILYFFNGWLSTAPKNQPYKRGDIPLYIMMGVGAFFLGKLLMTGSW